MKQSSRENQRKSIDLIRNSNAFDELIEPARLAPFGTSEAWYFMVNGNIIHVSCIKSNIIKLKMAERMNQINIGIAISHLCIAANYFHKSVKVFSSEPARQSQPDGYFYITSLEIY
jgi:hypothetical protein